MTENKTEENINYINSMSREAMCRLWRFAPAGHPFFVSGSKENEAFMKRFNELGKFSPEISKQLG